MPIYEYQCQSCGHAFETMQRLADAPLTACPQCEGPLKKLISAPAFQFKGSGWYVTDYSRPGGDKGSANSESAAKKTEGAGSESKSEAKSDAKPAESSSSKTDAPSAPAKSGSSTD